MTDNQNVFVFDLKKHFQQIHRIKCPRQLYTLLERARAQTGEKYCKEQRKRDWQSKCHALFHSFLWVKLMMNYPWLPFTYAFPLLLRQIWWTPHRLFSLPLLCASDTERLFFFLFGILCRKRELLFTGSGEKSTPVWPMPRKEKRKVWCVWERDISLYGHSAV